jgi:hypothetical protein
MIKEIPTMNNHIYYFGHSAFNFKAGVDIRSADMSYTHKIYVHGGQLYQDPYTNLQLAISI